MTPLAPSFFKQGKVLHAAACSVCFRRRDEAIEWLPITDPSIKGGFGEVNSCGCNFQTFQRCEKTSSKNPENPKKTGKEQSERLS